MGEGHGVPRLLDMRMEDVPRRRLNCGKKSYEFTLGLWRNTQLENLRDTTVNPPAYISHHWAKSDRAHPGRIHLLEHHLADVGACFEALLEQPIILGRLAASAGAQRLHESTKARLCVFAALHDIGKINVGFQTQIWQPSDFHDVRKNKPGWAGHTSDAVPVLTDRDSTTADWFFKALGWDDFLAWDDRDGWTASSLLAATLSHHGEPLNLHDSKAANPAVWRTFGRLDPQACVRRIGTQVRDWFPDAFATDAPPLPSSPQFQHMFLGLCTLADWIGSDEKHFPFSDEPDDGYIRKARKRARNAIAEVGLDISGQRAVFDGIPDFSSLFGIPHPPNAIQRAAFDAHVDEPVVIIESETGSGKTEAALWRFARMYEAGLVDGLYFALPTRAAASQIHARVNRFIAELFAAHKPEPVLAVPGYIQAGDFTGRHLQGYDVWWDTPDHDGDRRRFWAAESAKRFLAAQIAVGTVDQAMMAALQVRHSHMRAACLARNLLVVDEVHASDPYMSVIIEELLNAHVGAGGYALLMSATLGSSARSRWMLRPRRTSSLQLQPLDDAINDPYPSVSTRSGNDVKVAPVGTNSANKTVHIDTCGFMHDHSAIAALGLRAARSGAKVLIVRNTVTYAVNTQQALEEVASEDESDLLFACNGVRTLHTGRFAAEDRKLLDSAVEEQLGKGRDGGGLIVIGTQTLEQSLDIDADLLITDLCPIDVLLQRIGRLHRHGRADRPQPHSTPLCVVLTPPGADLSPLLSSGENANGLGTHGYVYPDLRILQLTLELVWNASNDGQPWRIPNMNRELVERATHPEALDTLVRCRGDEWVAHAGEITGARIGDIQTARNAIVRRDRTFLESEVAFKSDEERIRTRLGDEGIEVRLSPAPASPFDPSLSIEGIVIPARMTDRMMSEESVEPVSKGGSFKFAVGNSRYLYDRLGLRRL